MSKINTTSAELVSVACDKIRSYYSTFRFCVLRFSLKPLLKKTHTHKEEEILRIRKFWSSFQVWILLQFFLIFCCTIVFQNLLKWDNYESKTKQKKKKKKKIHAFSKQPNKLIYMRYISSCCWIFAYKWKKVPKNNEYDWWPKNPQ